MRFDRPLAQLLEVLRRESCVWYRALRRLFTPGKAAPEDLKTAISQAKTLTRGVWSPGLVLVGELPMPPVQD